MSLRNHFTSRIELPTFLAWWIAAALLLPAGAAGFASVHVVQRKLPAERDYVGAPAFDAKGDLWFGVGRHVSGTVPPEFAAAVGRISASGRFEEPVPAGTRFDAMTRGADGAIWFAGRLAIGRIGPAGLTTEYPTDGEPQDLAAGPDGNIWFTIGGGSYAAVGRVTPGGEVTEYGLPAAAQPIGITAGPEGDLWFAERSRHALARITTAGALTEFPLPEEASRPQGITEGPDGNLWFTDQGTGSVGRMTPAGRVSEFAVPTGPGYPGQIVSAPDGRLWFTSGQVGALGRITPEGLRTLVRLPDAESSPVGLAVGAAGEVAYTANGEGPCDGGGGSCQLLVPKVPAVVGTITSGPLQERATEGGVVNDGRMALTLACGGGSARDRCRGDVRLSVSRADGPTVSGVVGGAARFRLRADETRTVTLRLRAAVRRLIRARGQLRARVSIAGRGLRPSSKAITLYAAAPEPGS